MKLTRYLHCQRRRTETESIAHQNYAALMLAALSHWLMLHALGKKCTRCHNQFERICRRFEAATSTRRAPSATHHPDTSICKQRHSSICGATCVVLRGKPIYKWNKDDGMEGPVMREWQNHPQVPVVWGLGIRSLKRDPTCLHWSMKMNNEKCSTWGCWSLNDRFCLTMMCDTFPPW